MTDEIKLRRDALRAERAKTLIEDELLTEAFAGLEKQYTEALFQSAVNDVTGREKLFLAVNVLRKVRDHLGQVMADGSLARRELHNMAQIAEQQKTWADVH